MGKDEQDFLDFVALLFFKGKVEKAMEYMRQLSNDQKDYVVGRHILHLSVSGAFHAPKDKTQKPCWKSLTLPCGGEISFCRAR